MRRRQRHAVAFGLVAAGLLAAAASPADAQGGASTVAQPRPI